MSAEMRNEEKLLWFTKTARKRRRRRTEKPNWYFLCDLGATIAVVMSLLVALLIIARN